MVKERETKEFYDFVGFRLDTKNRLLWRAGKTVALTPKEYELLLIFVESGGSVLGKEDLLARIWNETYVEESTLARNVSWLRKKLGAANGNGEKFIETIPKRGYRFLPEVKRVENHPPAALVVEEQSLTRIRVEETISIDEDTQIGEKAMTGNRASDSKTLVSNGELQKVNNESRQADYELQIQNPKSKIQNRGSLWFVFAFGILAAAICFAVYGMYLHSSVPKTILAKKVAPFSGLPGREEMPAFSPDGKQLAFVWNRDENNKDFDVYVRLSGAGDPVRLTYNRADEINPTFSPDGSHVAFVRMFPTHSEVFLIPALGGAERKICDLRRSASSISFAPDGKHLAVNDNDSDGGQPGIFLVNIENGEKKRLTAPPELAADDRPAFAPDGRSIIFVRSFGKIANELFVMPFTGETSEPRQLTFDKTWIGGAAWSADGEKIIFASLRKHNSRTNIWQIELNENIAEPELIAAAGKRVGNLAVSPDNRTIAFVEDSFDTNIWRIEPKGTAESDNAVKFAASNRNDHSPNVSSDGSHVVFASSRTGNYEIWIADVDGSNTRQLTDFQKFQTGSPRFSPDGKWVVFDAQVDGNGDIFVVAVNGGEPRRLTEAPAFDFMPAWSADGNSIYFSSDRSGTPQIYKMPSAGGEAERITENGGRESYESPDGKQLYYSKSESSIGLWRVPAAGGEEQPVPELADAGSWRYWTMTPKGIYYVARVEFPPFKIMFYDFAANRTEEITKTEVSPIWVYPGLATSPDGKTIFYTQSDQSASSIMLAELEK